MIVYAVVDDAVSPDFALGVEIEVFIQHEDASLRAAVRGKPTSAAHPAIQRSPARHQLNSSMCLAGGFRSLLQGHAAAASLASTQAYAPHSQCRRPRKCGVCQASGVLVVVVADRSPHPPDPTRAADIAVADAEDVANWVAGLAADGAALEAGRLLHAARVAPRFERDYAS